MKKLDRRTFVAAASAAALWRVGPACAAGPVMTVHKDPTCGCCEAWVEHVRGAGYEARVVETGAIDVVKARLGVPLPVRSCHTAEVDGYVLEGHVPAEAIARLLKERPTARGLGVPGMPVGAPGMEVAGTAPQTYDVMLFGDGEPRSFMRFRGAVRLDPS